MEMAYKSLRRLSKPAPPLQLITEQQQQKIGLTKQALD